MALDADTVAWIAENRGVIPGSLAREDRPMLAAIATLIAKSGRGEELRDALIAATSLVRPNEIGVIAYHATRSRENPDIFKMLEIYRDQDALEVHRSGTPYIERLRQMIFMPLAEPPRVEFLDSILE